MEVKETNQTNQTTNKSQTKPNNNKTNQQKNPTKNKIKKNPTSLFLACRLLKSCKSCIATGKQRVHNFLDESPHTGFSWVNINMTVESPCILERRNKLKGCSSSLTIWGKPHFFIAHFFPWKGRMKANRCFLYENSISLVFLFRSQACNSFWPDRPFTCSINLRHLLEEDLEAFLAGKISTAVLTGLKSLLFST